MLAASCYIRATIIIHTTRQLPYHPYSYFAHLELLRGGFPIQAANLPKATAAENADTLLLQLQQNATEPLPPGTPLPLAVQNRPLLLATHDQRTIRFSVRASSFSDSASPL